MVFEILKRTNFDHSGGTQAQDHLQDFSEYHDPLARMEHANFFDWGIAQGLNVTGTIGTNSLQVQAGVAIDRDGRLISLAEGGFGDIGANPLATPPQSTPAPVPVTLTTTGHEGQTAFVTIQFSEFFSSSPSDPFDPGDFEQRPWIRLQDVSLFDPAHGALILARVTIDSGGLITSIHGEDRQMVKSSRGKLSLLKGQRPASGSFDISEDVTIELDGATADVSVGGAGQAGNLQVRDSSGDSTASIDGATGDMLLGGAGQAGNLQVRNTGGNPTASIDGLTGDMLLGGAGQAGDIKVRNSSGAPTAQISGASGDLKLGGSGQNGNLSLTNSLGSPTVEINGGAADLALGGAGQDGDIRMKDSSNRETIHMDGNSAAMHLGTSENAGDLYIKNTSGTTTTQISGQLGSIYVGGSGQAGELYLRNINGNTSIWLYGGSGDAYLGGDGQDGDLYVRNTSGSTRVHLDGQAGNVKLWGQLRDSSNRNIGLTFSQKQDLTDGGTSSAHRHNIGRFGLSGSLGTNIGVISGRVTISSGYISAGVSGSVRIRYSDRSAFPSGTGFSSRSMQGYRGNFLSSPNAIIAPTNLDLSTHDDTWFSFSHSASSTEITINWSFDTSGGSQEVKFLLIGRI